MLQFAILEALKRKCAVLIVLDGLAVTDMRAFAAHMSDVNTIAKRHQFEAPARLQTIVSCDEKLMGPEGARACVKLGLMSVSEQQAVSRAWFRKFGKENVSDEQV